MPCSSCGNNNQRQPSGGAVFMGNKRRNIQRRAFHQAKPIISNNQTVKKTTPVSKNNVMIFGSIHSK